MVQGNLSSWTCVQMASCPNLYPSMMVDAIVVNVWALRQLCEDEVKLNSRAVWWGRDVALGSFWNCDALNSPTSTLFLATTEDDDSNGFFMWVFMMRS